LPLAGVAFISFTFAHEVGLDEIIVTAIKREGTVQDVPSNIAALDGQRIDQQGFINKALVTQLVCCIVAGSIYNTRLSPKA